MSMKHLGQTFDIHTGGVDLIFPHHQNEVAQSEGATGQRFVNYWLHSGHLFFGGKKMAKSAGTVMNLDDVAKTNIEINAFRYLMLSTHYRAELNLTDESLKASKKTVQRLQRFRSSLQSVKSNGENRIQSLILKTHNSFIQALDQDLGTPRALAIIFDLINIIEKQYGVKNLTVGSATAVLDLLYVFDSIFSILPIDEESFEMQKEALALIPEIKQLVEERSLSRANGDWQRADEIRKVLLKKGVKLTDTEKGTTLERL